MQEIIKKILEEKNINISFEDIISFFEKEIEEDINGITPDNMEKFLVNINTDVEDFRVDFNDTTYRFIREDKVEDIQQEEELDKIEDLFKQFIKDENYLNSIVSCFDIEKFIKHTNTKPYDTFANNDGVEYYFENYHVYKQ